MSLIRRLFVAAILLFAAGDLAAQVATGVVTDESTGAPIRGAFVLLLNEQGKRIAGVLSGERGEFVFRAPAGRYTLRAERIGHTTRTLPAFSLEPFQTQTFAITLGVAALRLREISVRGEDRCTNRPDGSRATAEVWAEARKALAVAAWVQSGPAMFQTRAYETDLDLNLKAIAPPKYRFGNAAGKQAYHAIDPDTLARFGYVRSRNGETYLYGPDADLLLSNSFLTQHCFKLERRSDRRGLIGLSFEPIRGRRLPDIEGTLWLDESTAELRFIEYGYTGVEGWDDRRYSGGRTEFQQLPNGAWVVRRWYVRAPNLQRTNVSRALRIIGTHEEGGEIMAARVASDDAAMISRHAVRGIVFDSIRGITLEGARVYLSGTQFTARSGAGGRFVLDSVPRGEYLIAFEHPRLDSLPAYPHPVAVTVDSTTRPVELATPSLKSIISERCTKEQLKLALEATRDTTVRSRGLLYGNVSSVLGPVTGAHVEVSWQLISAGSGVGGVELNRISATPLRFETETDERGNYTLCGMATDRRLVFTVRNGGRILQRDTIAFWHHGLRRQDILLRR